MAVCLTTLCPTTDTKPPQISICDLETLKYGYLPPLWLDCTYQFTNILDTAEWAAILGTGELSCSPDGKSVVNAPTEQTYQYTDCGKKKIVYDTEYVVDVMSPFHLPDGSECEYWQEVYDKQRFLRVILRDCNGKVMLPKSQIDAIKAGTTNLSLVGYEFSFTQKPHHLNQNGLDEWKTQISIAEDYVLCKYEIPGLSTVLCC